MLTLIIVSNKDIYISFKEIKALRVSKCHSHQCDNTVPELTFQMQFSVTKILCVSGYSAFSKAVSSYSVFSMEREEKLLLMFFCSFSLPTRG